MVNLSKEQIQEIAAQYPLNSQAAKGADAFVCCKLQFPDRRESPVAYWYITGAGIAEDGEVTFDCLLISGMAAGGMATGIKSVWPSTITLSRLQGMTERGNKELTIELDQDFKPGTLREIYEAEPPVRYYVDRMNKEQHQAKIKAARDNINETIYRFFLALDSGGKGATVLANALTDDVVKIMQTSKKELMPALMHALLHRLGLLNTRKALLQQKSADADPQNTL